MNKFSVRFLDSLKTIGVDKNCLNSYEKNELNKKGFLLLKNHLDSDLINKLLETIEKIYLEEGPAAGVQKQNGSINLNEYGLEEGVRRVCDLVNKGEIFIFNAR